MTDTTTSPPLFARTIATALPLLARLTFAAVLLRYYWGSALTKVGDGPLGLFKPSAGAYAQIFPNGFEAAGYDPSQLTVFHWAVAVGGMWAEFLLPLAIVVGLYTRAAALGMIGFVAVQTFTDLFGHGVLAHAQTLGAWFDRAPDGAILDQRMLWIILLLTLVDRGAGPLSLDALLRSAPALRPASRQPAP
ncbi:DoxX family protein [Pseudooceanicola nanhaiensis]|uniref:DoxX family protein n=1 Tax=Pseudooceanicola nanhaiensis TaxID=375761 RepID=UPI001CD66155|nr:DoxX family protein [Pseudooceanicola nanhaiensis]MCA0922427.1 DoxX family protein [Pseudooceanicola nanhaiensis]